MPILSHIYVYPVKSLAGIQVQSWPVDKNGLLYDRKWMLIDDQQQFLSQRRLPKMALIKPRIEDDKLVLSAPGQRDLRIPLHPDKGDNIEVTIWRDHCVAKTVSEQANRWFSGFLRAKCQMVYLPTDAHRHVDRRYAQPSDQTAFSDGFPFLIISENSLNALNDEMEYPVDMIRFRPNLVISDCDAYAEDTWRRIRINDIGFRLPKPCSRCSIPTIDPETAISGEEPLVTLRRLRNWQNQIYFGQNALHDMTGKLNVGNKVEIIETGNMQPPLVVNDD
ncbi:MAG: MOSC domain-containing protein [Gammaproteobacteria bacterium]